MKPLFLTSLLLCPAIALAQNAPTRVELPLRQVALFSSGVGYFERAGNVNGDASIELSFRKAQLSDVLKSLILLDPKGRVAPVTYSIEDYLGARPSASDLPLDAEATPGAILKSLQGALVHLETKTAKIEGRVVSVSTKTIGKGDDKTEVEIVTILGENGIQTVQLDEVTSFRPLDAALAAKLRGSLEKLALNLARGLDDGARAVTLQFRGKGNRAVSAGYLQEMPVWKTSYRLVLDAKAKPYLQGWANVENTTDADWNAVQLSLISGRPVSFTQDVVAPVYLTRPNVAPYIIGTPDPKRYASGLDDEAVPPAPPASMSGPMGPAGAANEAADGRADKPRAAPRLSFSPQILHQEGYAGYTNSGRNFLNANAAALAQGANATGAQTGDLFAYVIDAPVSIERGQAALVPIIGQNIGGDAVTIVDSNRQIGAQSAMNGFELRNADLHLQGGSLTVYSGGTYAGDALIDNVAPGEKRLLSYAVDLDVAARLDKVENDGSILALGASDGNLRVSRRATRDWIYLVKNKTAAPKNILLQQPLENDWKLSDPKQVAEKSDDGQRFRFVAPAQKTTTYEIKTERTYTELVALRNIDVNGFAFYGGQKSLPPALKAAFANLQALQSKVAEIAGQKAAQEKRLQDIETDQTRIRENMKALPQNSELFKSYMAKLTAQENEVERVRAEIERLRAAQVAAQANLDRAIAAIDVK